MVDLNNYVYIYLSYIYVAITQYNRYRDEKGTLLILPCTERQFLLIETLKSLSKYLNIIFFFKSFWQTHVHFWGHWYPCFGFLVTSPQGFKARVGCLIRIAEANVMYITRDPPLVLHLPTSWRPAHSRSCPHILLQR